VRKREEGKDAGIEEQNKIGEPLFFFFQFLMLFIPAL